MFQRKSCKADARGRVREVEVGQMLLRKPGKTIARINEMLDRF